MHLESRFRTGIFVAALSLLLWPSVFYAQSATDCSQLGAGYRPAVASDPAVQNGEIPLGTCYNPQSAVGINVQAEAAKAFLRTRYQAGSCSAKNPSPNDAIDKLDAQFAIHLADMLQRAPMNITIISAYRSPAAQQCANPSVTGSNHLRGCAVDLGYDQNSCSSDTCKWVVQNAPQDKLQIRMRYAPEWNHLEPITCGGTSLGTATSRPINGPGSYVPQAMNTLNSFGSLNNLFSPPQPQQCPTGYTMLNGTCMPQQYVNNTQTPSPLSYLSPPPPPPTPFSPSPSPSYINPTSFTPGNTNTNTNTNTNLNTNNNRVNISDLINPSPSIDTNGKGTTTSALDLINDIAYPTTTTDHQQQPAATSSPVPLTSSLNNTVALHGTPVTINSSWQASTTYALSPTVSQTFVSQDLSQTQTNLSTTRPANTTFAILEDLKQKLLNALAYLRPFGGVVPRVATNNSATAVLQ